MPSVLSTPLLQNPITTILQSRQLTQLKSQATSTYSFLFQRWVPRHWLSKTLLYAFRWMMKISFKAVRLGVKYSGIFLLMKLLSRHVRLLVTLLSAQVIWTNFVSRYYYIIMSYLHGVFNPSQREKRQNLSTRIQKAENYQEWALATSQLDELDGLTTWKMDNTSKYYDYQRLERFCSILLHLYLTENSPAIMLLLSSHLSRNFCGILNPELYNVLGVGTKQLIEDYIQLVHNSLELVSQDESIPLSERLSFISKLRHVFGRSGLLLSGGATLSLMHSGVMVELVRAGLCPTVISGSSGGSILGCLLAARTDKEFLDLIIHDPERIFTYMYYLEPQTQRHEELYGSLPNFPPRPRNTLFDIRILQHAIRQIIPSNATFLDLYHHSGGRIFNVVIHSSTLASGFFVANYLTAPHVYVASAVAASCALPGVFEPAPILYSQTYTKLILSYLRGKLGALVQQQLSVITNVNNTNPTTPPSTNDDETPVNSLSPEITIKPLITDSQALVIATPQQQRLLNSKAIDPTLIHDSLKNVVTGLSPPQPSSAQTTVTPTTSTTSTAVVNTNNTNVTTVTTPTTTSPTQPTKTEMKSLFDNDLTESEHQSITELFGDTRLYQDGSLGADLPFDVLKEQFGVNFSIVSQVNPHIAPILKCFPSFYPNYSNRPFSISFITHLMNLSLHIIEYLFSSFRSVLLNLTEAKLLPWFPSTLRSMLSQTYSGDMTILPASLHWEDYKTAINNPNLKLLVSYRDDAIKHTWRYITRLKIASKIEHSLQKISYSLRLRYQSQPVYGPGGKPMGISSLGSSAHLNYLVPPQTPTLCRIQSSTETSLLKKSPGLKQSTSLNGINTATSSSSSTVNNNTKDTAVVNTKEKSKNTSKGSVNKNNNDLTNLDMDELIHQQPPKISTLSRRSSFFRQTYIDNNKTDSDTDSNAALTDSTTTNDNNKKVKKGQNKIISPEDFRNVNDADPNEYYDPDCYLYEDELTPPDSPSSLPSNGTIVNVKNDDSIIQKVGHNEDVKVLEPSTITDNQSTSNQHLQPIESLNTPPLNPMIVGDLSSSDQLLAPSKSTNPLRSKHSSSFYRIKSSFGSIEPGQNPTANTMLSSPTTPSKFVSTILLPVSSQNSINNPNYPLGYYNTNSQYQPQSPSYNNNNNAQQAQQQSNNNNNNNQHNLIAGLPRNHSHGSSISSISQYHGDGDGNHTPGMYPQQPHNDSGINMNLNNNNNNNNNINDPTNPNNNFSLNPPEFSPYLTSPPHPQLYHVPSDDSLSYNDRFYPSNGELAFEQF